MAATAQQVSAGGVPRQDTLKLIRGGGAPPVVDGIDDVVRAPEEPVPPPCPQVEHGSLVLGDPRVTGVDELLREAIAPAMLGSQRPRPSVETPSRRLLLAVLEDGLKLASGGAAYAHNHDATRARREARAWVRSNERGWPFTFLDCCETLGVDPAWIRRRLERSAPIDTARRDIGARTRTTTRPPLGAWGGRPSSPYLPTYVRGGHQNR